MGHYLVGRWCGIGVKAFSIGFGPELIGFNDRRGTRWKLCAIPLGGYVKFVGDMNAVSQPDQAEIETLSDAERKVAFHTQPVWKRAATVFAGPLFNFLLTIAVLAVLFPIYGRVGRAADGCRVCRAARPPGLASCPGTGSSALTAQGRELRRRAASGVRPSRRRHHLRHAARRQGGHAGRDAQLVEQEDALGNKVKVAVIGVVNNEEVGQPRFITYSPVGAVVEAVRETVHIVERTGQFMKRFAVGREDKCQLGGPLKIGAMAGRAAALGFPRLVQLVALLSIGIGILNLLPIPPLDGGHLLFYAIEAVIRRPVSERVMEMVLSSRLHGGTASSWDSCSGTICLVVEIMKEFGLMGCWFRMRLPCGRDIGVTGKPRRLVK